MDLRSTVLDLDLFCAGVCALQLLTGDKDLQSTVLDLHVDLFFTGVGELQLLTGDKDLQSTVFDLDLFLTGVRELQLLTGDTDLQSTVPRSGEMDVDFLSFGVENLVP